VLVALLATLVTRSVAIAETVDTEVARRHFELGRSLYEARNYDAACVEFEAARQVLALPALDYNLAKCEERRERWARSVEAYERYLASAPPSDAGTIAEVQARVAVLRERVDRVHSAERRRLRIAGITLAVGALAVAAAGTGGYLSAWRDYQAERTLCTAQPCAPASYPDLTDRVHRAQIAGYSLWGLGAALAIADIAVWAAYARLSPVRVHAWIAPAGSGVAAGGTF
jgi:hypothetical protein